MGIKFKFVIQANTLSNSDITIEMSKNMIKDPLFGKINFTKCSFSTDRNKLSEVSVWFKPYSLKNQSDWIFATNIEKYNIIKLINAFVTKYTESCSLVQNLQFDLKTLTIPETLTARQLRRLIDSVVVLPTGEVNIKLVFKPSIKRC